jgi:hypothetical protein
VYAALSYLRQLDTKVHYIFSGCYAATVDNGGEQQWTLVMGARGTLFTCVTGTKVLILT